MTMRCRRPCLPARHGLYCACRTARRANVDGDFGEAWAMGLAILVLGLVVFLGTHVFVTLRAPRAAVIQQIGEWPYKGLMSLVSLAGLILLGYGFRRLRSTGWYNVLFPP